MLTHGNLMANLEVIRNAFEISSDSVGFFWLPFYHDMGLIGGILEPVYSKVHVTWISPLDFLQRPLRWLKAISQGKATISGVPNFAYDLCVRKATPEFIEILDLINWVLAFNGAEPIRASTIENFSRTFEPSVSGEKHFIPVMVWLRRLYWLQV